MSHTDSTSFVSTEYPIYIYHNNFNTSIAAHAETAAFPLAVTCCSMVIMDIVTYKHLSRLYRCPISSRQKEDKACCGYPSGNMYFESGSVTTAV